MGGTNICGKMSLGYGSKYQLLRMLGWHQNFLNNKIADVIGSSNDIRWLDFEFDGPEDKEIINAKFLDNEMEKNWEEIWPTYGGRNGINWDAIGTVDGEFILIEAKAHLEECSGSIRGGGKNSDKAIRAINCFQDKYKISRMDWLDKEYYQLANRLVFLDFLLTQGFKASLVYILFLNGYEFNIADGQIKSVRNQNDWEEEFNNRLEEMGILGTEAEHLIHFCYIDCNSK